MKVVCKVVHWQPDTTHRLSVCVCLVKACCWPRPCISDETVGLTDLTSPRPNCQSKPPYSLQELQSNIFQHYLLHLQSYYEYILTLLWQHTSVCVCEWERAWGSEAYFLQIKEQLLCNLWNVAQAKGTKRCEAEQRERQKSIVMKH